MLRLVSRSRLSLISNPACSKPVRNIRFTHDELVNTPNHRQLVDQFASDLGYKSPEEFYKISLKELKERYPQLDYKHPYTLLSSLYPEHTWLPWKFSQLPPNFWKDLSNQRSFLDWAGTQLGLKDLNGWYDIHIKDLNDLGGAGLLKLYNNSLIVLLSNVYSEHEWLPWKFGKISHKFWSEIGNQRKYLNWVGKQLGYKKFSDWYKVTYKDIVSLGGSTILVNTYASSPYKMLSTVYPTYQWLPWKFARGNYWNSIDNQKKFLDWVGKKMGYKEFSDWYNIKITDIIELGGSTLHTKYQSSPHLLLSNVYPEYNWLPWKFAKSTAGYWANMENQRKCLDEIEKQLEIKDKSDWYKVKAQDIDRLGGSSLLTLYGDSPISMLSSVYSEYNWLPWKFSKLPKNFWNETTIKQFLEWAAPQFGVNEVNDWSKVSRQSLIEHGGTFLIKYNLSDLIELFYQVQIKMKTASSRKTQSLIKSLLQFMFQDEEMMEEFRHPDILSPAGQPLEFDFYFPKLKLAIEYQGIQHYRPVKLFSENSLEELQKRDFSKVVLAKDKGITLIEVPYWWDRNYSSLEATINVQRPELFSTSPKGSPIPIQKPSKEQSLQAETVRRVMAATVWDDSKDPTGWWMTEKYDGVRLYWDGSQFYNRQGGKIQVPDFFSSEMPNVPLDGELWTQYGLYQDAVGLCSRYGLKDTDKWKKAVFWVFDAPGEEKLYEERLGYLSKLQLPSHAKVIPAIKCQGANHLKEYFREIVAKGGEGVMLRQPESVYKSGRSSSLRKYKEYFDTEVKVLKNNYPHGLSCVQANGKYLFVGITEETDDSAKLVKEGAVVTVKYLGTNVHGTLQYPKFFRERTDVSWKDLLIQGTG